MAPLLSCTSGALGIHVPSCPESRLVPVGTVSPTGNLVEGVDS